MYFASFARAATSLIAPSRSSSDRWPYARSESEKSLSQNAFLSWSGGTRLSSMFRQAKDRSRDSHSFQPSSCSATPNDNVSTGAVGSRSSSLAVAAAAPRARGTSTDKSSGFWRSGSRPARTNLCTPEAERSLRRPPATLQGSFHRFGAIGGMAGFAGIAAAIWPAYRARRASLEQSLFSFC